MASSSANDRRDGAPAPGGAERLPKTLLLLLLAMAAVIFLRDLWVQVRAVDPLPYSEFAAQLDASNVESVVVSQRKISRRAETAAARRAAPVRHHARRTGVDGEARAPRRQGDR